MALDSKKFEEMTTAIAAAWSSGDPAAVADYYAPGKGITINRGENQFGREAMIAMAGGFMAAFPDMKLRCDLSRWAGDHGLFCWTFKGHHAETGNEVEVSGWEEWDLDENGLIANSLGWFDAVGYERKVNGE
jgi:nuclear transport factor 2 (NTF2) superfamily protein